MTTLAFIGFGEAAQAIARGLAGTAGVSRLCAHDIRFEAAPELRRAAQDCGVEILSGISGIAAADIVLSLVVGAAALPVAQAGAPHLKAGQIYIDLNSIGPEAKASIGKAIESGAGSFVEGAVMARVPPYGARVPILLAGPRAGEAAGALNALGMNCEAVGDRIGQACAVKMIRSVVIKGIEALLIESLTAAERAGVTERILDSIAETFPGIDWRASASYYIGRTHQHGARRVTEMTEAAETLKSFGVEPVLSIAIATTIGTAHARLAQSAVRPNAPYHELLLALAGGLPSADATGGT